VDGEQLTPKRQSINNLSVAHGISSSLKKDSFVRFESGSLLKKKRKSKIERESE